MKKVVLSVLLLLAALAPQCLAQFQNPPIVDEAGYLTQSQFEQLSTALEELRTAYNFDVAIYTEHTRPTSTARSRADDLFDYQGYGAGSGDDGMLLYLCADTREYWFTTHGAGQTYFNERGLAYLESKVLPKLKKNDYFGAMEQYARYAQKLLEMASQGKPYNREPRSGTYVLCVIGGALLLPLLLAFLMMKYQLSKMKTVARQDSAAGYIKPGSVNLTVSKDLFLYSTVTKTARPKAENSSTSSGSHTSSSGRSHGGRGGSF